MDLRQVEFLSMSSRLYHSRTCACRLLHGQGAAPPPCSCTSGCTFHVYSNPNIYMSRIASLGSRGAVRAPRPPGPAPRTLSLPHRHPPAATPRPGVSLPVAVPLSASVASLFRNRRTRRPRHAHWARRPRARAVYMASRHTGSGTRNISIDSNARVASRPQARGRRAGI